MNIKINFYKYLRNNMDEIVELIYRKVLKNTINVGKVSVLFRISFDRLLSIVKWIYFGFFMTLLIYIISILNYILKYMQNIGKKILEFILTLTGPLSPEVLNNIWLFMVLLCILIIIIIFIKLVKYYKKKNLKLEEERNFFKEDLIKKLLEQDEIVNKQLKEIIIKENVNIYEIKLYNNIFFIDISKLKR